MHQSKVSRSGTGHKLGFPMGALIGNAYRTIKED